MMTPSQSFLLRCLSDFLQGSSTVDDCGDKDWEWLFRTAAEHSLDGILYFQCRSIMPFDIKKRYMKRYLGNLAISLQREEAVADLVRRFEREQIPILFMKGAVIRDLYPVPALRSMGDIDMLVRPEDREKSDIILREEMGMERFIEDQAVWTYYKGNVFIEVHDHMFYEQLATVTDYRSFFDQVWLHCHHAQVFGTESSNVFIPDESFHFLYLAAHTAKHIINSGSGFRAYMDMVLMARACGKMDWERECCELEALSLLQFTKICMGLCERWFGIRTSMALTEVDIAFQETVTEKTFHDGVFGLRNSENRGAGAAREIKRSGGPYIAGALKRTIRKLFPSYSDMELVPWYSFLSGRPWLLPVAWLYRWVYCIVKKARHGAELLLEPFLHKREVIGRQEYLKRWGL